jgi:hypothetical protein
MAKPPGTFALTCAHATSVSPIAADRLCASLHEAMVKSGWENIINLPDMTIQMDVQAAAPTSMRLTLTLTNPDGRTQQINRGLSAADTTITPATQARFLQSLVAAIPSDF